MRVGIDLDNTLISYDQAFQRVAKEEGLLPASFEGNKAAVKRALLAERPDGLLWESLQGLVYGRRIDAAVLFDGVAGFLEACRTRADVVAIVSHKTELAHHDPHMTDLRDGRAALDGEQSLLRCGGPRHRPPQRLFRRHAGREGEADTVA